jgi:hypothetical protein
MKVKIKTLEQMREEYGGRVGIGLDTVYASKQELCAKLSTAFIK